MNKVGIITLYGMNNYGNRLQNYAVNALLRNDFITINYIKEKITLNIAMLVSHAKRCNFGEIKRYIIFMLFDCSSKKRYMRGIKYKTTDISFILCGSDQIWYPCSSPDYFAAFVEKNKRISYAASFGVAEIPSVVRNEYAKYLSEMKAISVREETGAKIVKELTGRDVPVLIDPTLMLDKEDWQKVSKKPKYKIGDKYILTYFLGEISEKRNSYIENIAKNNGLQIIRLEASNPNKYWYGTGPAEFIWLIEHCSLMCTDSFHGSVFSVLMDVPFIVFEREDKLKSMSSRIDTLLSILKLEDRRFDNQNGEEIFKKEYAHIPEILKTERDKAIHFLKNAMELE